MLCKGVKIDKQDWTKILCEIKALFINTTSILDIVFLPIPPAFLMCAAAQGLAKWRYETQRKEIFCSSLIYSSFNAFSVAYHVCSAADKSSINEEDNASSKRLLCFILRYFLQYSYLLPTQTLCWQSMWNQMAMSVFTHTGLLGELQRCLGEECLSERGLGLPQRLIVINTFLWAQPATTNNGGISAHSVNSEDCAPLHF